jgi:hypothetical protein
MTSKGSEYRKSETNGVTTFEVTPAPAPKSGCFIVLAVPVLLWGLFTFLGGGGGLLLGGIVMLIGFFLFKFALKDIRPKEHQQIAIFRVGPDHVEVKEQVFKRSDIHRLVLRNAITKDELADLKVQLASNAAASVGMALGNAKKAQFQPIANALTLESGGKSTFLAGGMDETTAYGLKEDVSRIVSIKG